MVKILSVCLSACFWILARVVHIVIDSYRLVILHALHKIKTLPNPNIVVLYELLHMIVHNCVTQYSTDQF